MALESLHMGLLPTVSFKCRTEAGICDRPLDFTSDPHAAVIAEAIWYLAASLVHGKIRRTVQATAASLLAATRKSSRPSAGRWPMMSFGRLPSGCAWP